MTDKISPATTQMTPAAKKLEVNHSALSLSFTSLGTQRKVSSGQKAEAADIFEADDRHLSMSKKLFDTKHPAFRKVTRIRGQIEEYFKENSLPYPEESVRLFRMQDVPKVVERLETMKAEFLDAVSELNDCYMDLVEQAKDRLGRLYDPSDYPASLVEKFNVQWIFRNVNPPDYLMNLNPALFEQEKRKMQERFQEAVRLAEDAFADELTKLVEHLHNRLSGTNEDGERNVFRNTAITNLQEFFGKFKKLNIRSNPELDKLVEDAEKLIEGVDVDKIRHNYPLRDRIANQMAAVKEKLDTFTTSQPRRKVNRGGSRKNGDAA
jgi:hypothetical protein